MPLLDIFREVSQDWLFLKMAQAQLSTSVPTKEIIPGNEYLNITLRSMRIVNTRTAWNKFYGAVHSQIKLNTQDGPAEFNVITTPGKLQSLDAKRLDKVIIQDIPLLGPIPYNGGLLEFQVGLFSVKSEDLVEPFLTVLSEMSAQSGVSLLSSAKPFVGPLKKGAELALGTSDNSKLEIGLSKTYNRMTTGVFVVMRADKDSINEDDLLIDKDYRLIDRAGKSIKDYPYLVFEISSDPHRNGFFDIQELSAAYRTINKCLRERKIVDAQEALINFKFAVLNSPDLIYSDAQLIYDNVEAQVNKQLAMLSLLSKTTDRGDDNMKGQKTSQEFSLPPLESLSPF